MSSIDPTWRFPPKRRDELSIDPFEGELFAQHENAVLALVREAIQNSLDAKAPDSQRVRVRFTLQSADLALPPDEYQPFVAHLAPHLAALSTSFPRFNAPMEFMVIEDFGTAGLTGEPLMASDTDEKGAPRNNFFYFWRNVGRSKKGNLDRGRWGLGKTVFAAASQINTFFGLTRRRGETHGLLMGQAVLKLHRVGGIEHLPYGYFGEFENDGFAIPVRDDANIAKFSEAFRLERTDEPGLSIVVPFCQVRDPEDNDGFTVEGLVEAVIQQYFFPVLNGELEVVVENGSKCVEITSSSIESVISEFATNVEEAKLLQKKMELARWAISGPELVITSDPKEHSPSWAEESFGEEKLPTLRQRFEAGDPIAVLARVKVHPKGSDPTISAFSIFLQKDEAAGSGNRDFVRRGITIPNDDEMKCSGVRGLVVIDDPAVSGLLGDAENPAHTRWNEKSERTKKKYVYAPATIRFVKESFDRVAKLLSKPPEGLEEDLLSDIFGIEIPGAAGSSGARPSRRRGKKAPPPELKIEPRPKRYDIRKTTGGFVVVPASEVDSTREEAVIKAGYVTSAGDALGAWEPLDFDFASAPVVIEAKGAVPKAVAGNRATYLIEDKSYRIEFSGFDTRRDLEVDVKLREGSAE